MRCNAHAQPQKPALSCVTTTHVDRLAQLLQVCCQGGARCHRPHAVDDTVNSAVACQHLLNDALHLQQQHGMVAAQQLLVPGSMGWVQPLSCARCQPTEAGSRASAGMASTPDSSLCRACSLLVPSADRTAADGACAPLAFARRRERAAPMPPVAPKTTVTGPCAPLPVAYAARCQIEADSSRLAAAPTSTLLSNILSVWRYRAV